MSLKETISATTAGDRILFVLLLILSFLGIFFIREVIPGTEGVTIEVEGKVKYKYPLEDDRSIRVEGSRGHLTVEIKDGRVRVTDASCPNRLCEYQGWVTNGVIVCLPNRITITVGGHKSKEKSVDAVTG